MELLNLLNAHYKGQFDLHIAGNSVSICANFRIVVITFREGVSTVYFNLDEQDFQQNFTDPGHVLPFIICRLQLDPRLPDYRNFCEQQAARYHALFAEVPVNSPDYQEYLDEKIGYFTFCGDEHTGWSLKPLDTPERWAPGAVFIELSTGHIFQAVGGTEYDGATGFKQVWFNRETIKLKRPALCQEVQP